MSAVNAITRDGEQGLFVTTSDALYAVSAAGVVREVVRFVNQSGFGIAPICGAIELEDRWIYGAQGEISGRLYRVRRDGSEFQPVRDFPNFPHAGISSPEDYHSGVLHRDPEGGFTGIFRAGVYSWGGWPTGDSARGTAAVFRISANGSFRMMPIPVTFATDAILGPDGMFAIVAGDSSQVEGVPRAFYRMAADGSGFSKQSVAAAGIALVPGAVLDADGSMWAVSSSKSPIAPFGSFDGIVKFPPSGQTVVETFPFMGATDPLFAMSVGGLARVGENLYGHCKSPDTGGCPYRVTPDGTIEKVLAFERYPVPPRRVAGHGPVVLGDGTIVIPSQEDQASTSLRLHAYRPPEGSWEYNFGTAPGGLPYIAERNERFGIIPGPGPVVWITENETAGGLLAVRVLRLSTDTGAMEVIGSVRQINLEGTYWGKHPTLASDGRWYAGARSGDSSIHQGLIFRFGEQPNSFQVMRRFPSDGSMGLFPVGKLFEAEPGWLFGTVMVAPSGGSGGAVYRIRLDGTGFEKLAELPGEVVGGLMEGADGNLYVFVKVAGEDAGMVLMRMRVPTHDMEVFARWRESEFGGLVFDGPPIQGADRRFYVTAYRNASPWPGLITSVGPSGADPRVDLELADRSLGVRFVPPLAVGPSGWMYAATYGGGAAGYGGVFRFRPRLELRSTATKLGVQSFPGARVRIEAASELGGKWVVEGAEVPLDEQGKGEAIIGSGEGQRFFRAVFREEE